MQTLFSGPRPQQQQPCRPKNGSVSILRPPLPDLRLPVPPLPLLFLFLEKSTSSAAAICKSEPNAAFPYDTLSLSVSLARFGEPLPSFLPSSSPSFPPRCLLASFLPAPHHLSSTSHHPGHAPPSPPRRLLQQVTTSTLDHSHSPSTSARLWPRPPLSTQPSRPDSSAATSTTPAVTHTACLPRPIPHIHPRLSPTPRFPLTMSHPPRPTPQSHRARPLPPCPRARCTRPRTQNSTRSHIAKPSPVPMCKVPQIRCHPGKPPSHAQTRPPFPRTTPPPSPTTPFRDHPRLRAPSRCVAACEGPHSKA